MQETNKTLEDRIEEYKLQLSNRNIILGSIEVSKQTVNILKQLISESRCVSIRALMERILKIGHELLSSDPTQCCISNMVLRVLKIIREEYISLINGGNENTDQHLSVDYDTDCTQQFSNLKGTMIEAIGELLTEIENSLENIAAQALDHIHADETIMTLGFSQTVEAFLKNAARKRNFHVFCTETEPRLQGHKLAHSLQAADISVTLIPDSHVYAVMRGVSKVIVGTHTVFAEGGLKALCGTYNMALAAKIHHVPVFVCAGAYKLSQEHFRSEQQEGFHKSGNPNLVLTVEELAGMEDVEVGTCVFEHVPPDMIDLFIFNIGTSSPSVAYRLLKDFYHPADRLVKLLA